MDAITFYDASLVCGAAPAIGCGSRSTPLLLDLEEHRATSEAWLNRAGTIIGIVWSGPPRTEAVAKPLFKKHEIQNRNCEGGSRLSWGGRADQIRFSTTMKAATLSLKGRGFAYKRLRCPRRLECLSRSSGLVKAARYC